MFDVVIENGRVFDGRGSPAPLAHVGVTGGRIAEVSEAPLPKGPSTRVIDAEGFWVTPGFVDLHTHYDAEVEVAPSLSESVRHGVTTITMGSCSLSLAVGRPEDLADQFARVEAIPYDVVRRVMEEKKTWETLTDYFAHLSELPLGANVTSFVGHSAVRAHVMGIERSLDPKVRPTAPELERLDALLNEGLDQGYLGLSIQTLPWDKMGGDRFFRSRSLPSTFATWREYRRLTRILRERGRILQGVPNITTKVNIVLFVLESMGLFRKALKTTVISMMDTRANRGIHRLCGALSWMANHVLRGNFKWQALPEVFDLWADGIDLVVFEEFGAGAAALHLKDQVARADLFKNPDYRDAFKRQWTSKFLPKTFHRDLSVATILQCPDPTVVGKSFFQVAQERRESPVDVFLDLVSEHGTRLRWYTVMANDRPGPLAYIVKHPDVLVGFSDAGAHLRNMAHYNFPLRMLRLVRDAEAKGRPIMSLERAVHRLTGEIADWMGVDAGKLERGKRADVAVIDPTKLTDALDHPVEAPIASFAGFPRLVNRDEGAVRAVLINGRPAVSEGVVQPQLGVERGFGQVLRALA